METAMLIAYKKGTIDAAALADELGVRTMIVKKLWSITAS